MEEGVAQRVVLSVNVVDIFAGESTDDLDHNTIENRKLKVKMMPVSTCCFVMYLLPFLVNSVFLLLAQFHQLFMVLWSKWVRRRRRKCVSHRRLRNVPTAKYFLHFLGNQWNEFPSLHLFLFL